jgi:hypothetical protein
VRKNGITEATLVDERERVQKFRQRFELMGFQFVKRQSSLVYVLIEMFFTGTTFDLRYLCRAKRFVQDQELIR